MIMYYIIVLSMLLLLCLFVWLCRKYVTKSSAETDTSSMMITSGVSLIVSAFPGTKEMIISFVSSIMEKEVSYSTDYAAILCGFILIVGGVVFRHNIKDKIYVLNMFGIRVQNEISDEQNIKDLKLADFKVKEIIIDFVDIFDSEITDKINRIIVNKIKKICTAFINRSKGFKSCFSGMAPIPYTILAGTYLGGGTVRRYFEYKRSESKYYELIRHHIFKKCGMLITQYPGELKTDATEVVVALSITQKVQKIDLHQFSDMDIIEIGLDNPKDNVITTVEQLDKYANEVIGQIENLKQKYPAIQVVHLAASIPSCMSIELGKLFALNTHRLPKIISYHFVNTSTPKYPFGIVVSDGVTANIGTLIKE